MTGSKVALYANEIEACMYMGAEKLEDGTLKSYKDFTAEEIQEQSIFEYQTGCEAFRRKNC